MNIIGLFEKLQLDKSRLQQFTPDEIIRIEKHINVEKRLNPDIDVNVASRLTEALRTYPEAFYFITQNRILYNFFAGTQYSRDHFHLDEVSIDPSQVQQFIERYLMEDLSLYIEQKISENQFEPLREIMSEFNYFPEELLLRITRKAFHKIDFAMNQYSNPNYDFARINYIKTSAFYQFLSFLSSPEMDEKVKNILNPVVDSYNSNKNSNASTIMVAMASYKPFDDELEGTLQNNRDVVFGNSGSKKSSGFSINWKVFAIILVILLRVGSVASRCSDSDTVKTYDSNSGSNSSTSSEEPPIIDRYYTDMKYKIDSFYVFLTEFDPKQIRQVEPLSKITIGNNPFTTFYTDHVTNNSNERFQTIRNKTSYEVVILENVVVFDSIKMPAKAFYLAPNTTMQVNTSDYNKRIYNFYAGHDLASFQDPSRHYFIGNHSNVENRFSKLAPNAKELIRKDCRTEGTIELREEKGKIEVYSKDAVPVVEEIQEAEK